MSKRNRVAPRLDPAAGFDQADNEPSLAAEEVGNATAVAELPADTATAEQAEPPATPDAGQAGTASETAVPACICKSVLGNLGQSDGYKSRHIDLQLAPGEQEIVARLRAGLVAQHAQLAPRSNDRNGKHVETASDTVRWLIQQVAGLSIAAAGS